MVGFVYLCLGFLIGYVVWSFVNAVLTLIFGKILGYEFLSFYFYFIEIKKENGKISFKVGNTQLATSCGMSKKDSSDMDTAMYSFLPAFAGLLITPVFWHFYRASELSVIWRNGIIIYGLLFVWTLVLSLIMMNRCFSKSPKAVMWRKTNSLFNAVKNGTRPGELDIDDGEIPKGKLKDINDLRYYLFLFYYYLEKYDYGKLKEIVDLFEVNMPGTHANYYTPYIYETIFYYSCIAPDSNKAESYYAAIEDNLTGDKDANGRRVYAYYLYCNNKGSKRALDVAWEGMSVVDSLPHKGFGIMERDLLEQLINEIGEV